MLTPGRLSLLPHLLVLITVALIPKTSSKMPLTSVWTMNKSTTPSKATDKIKKPKRKPNEYIMMMMLFVLPVPRTYKTTYVE